MSAEVRPVESTPSTMSSSNKAGIRSIFGRPSRPAEISRGLGPSTVSSAGSRMHASTREEPHVGNVVLYSIFQASVDSPTPAAAAAATAPTPTPTATEASMPRSSSQRSQRPARAPTRVAASKKASERFSPMGRWSPPPLFEAYPQAVKHAYLETPVTPAEELVRRHHYERYTRLRHEMVRQTGKNTSVLGPPDRIALDHATAAVPTPVECHNKIVVLVQGGYLLQYADKGSYDRLPEKVLPLSKNSVTFASDAIPGKPWVLQVSQRSSGAETGTMDNATSVFLRLSLRGSTARKVVGSLLLILYSADEMDAWLTTVRGQIESMGGRPPSIEVREPEKSSMPILLSLGRHHNKLALAVRRPPPENIPTWSQRSEPEGRVPSEREPDDEHHHRPLAQVTESNLADHRSSFRPSFDASSVSPTVASDDQMQLDRLRDDIRLSHSSSASSNPPSTETSLAGSPAKEDHHRLPTSGLVIIGRPTLPIRHSPRLPTRMTTVATTARATRSTETHPSTSSAAATTITSNTLEVPRTPNLADSPSPVSTDVDIPSSFEAVSPRSVVPFVLGGTEEPHPGRRMSIGSTSPASLTPSSPQPAPEQLWGQAEWVDRSHSLGRRTWSESSHADLVEGSDSTAAISRSILQLLAIGASDEAIMVPSSPRPRRSPSTRRGSSQRPRRRRRPSNRSLGSRSGLTSPTSPKMNAVTNASSSYYPEPLRINKRASLFVAVSSPPPLPPPSYPLPAIPAEPLPCTPTKDTRMSELRKQSWKVTRMYHPLRVDVV